MIMLICIYANKSHSVINEKCNVTKYFIFIFNLEVSILICVYIDILLIFLCLTRYYEYVYPSGRKELIYIRVHPLTNVHTSKM